MYEQLLKKANVVGAGIGHKTVGGKKTSDLSIVVMVTEKLHEDALRKKDLVPLEYGGIPTDVVRTGLIEAFPTTGKFRPAPGGVSIGHKDITAGTLGVVLNSGFGERVILSNNHVLANSNGASIGDEILQPGPYDRGRLGVDDIARLEKFVPIKFNQSFVCPIAENTAAVANVFARMVNSSRRLAVETAYNLVDAAIATPLEDNDVIDNILNVGYITGTREAFLETPLRKHGRTTDLTEGEVLVLHATVNVSYGTGKQARFEDQIVAGDMSAGGDSGSLVVHRDSQDAVGLLFAGSDTTTILNPIEYVLDALQLKF